MDLKELEPYTVIPIAEATVQDHADHALRIMDGEIEPGVRALWCDDEASVVAFLFDGRFTEERARAWVEEAEENGVNLAALQASSSPAYLNRLVILLKEYVPTPIFTAASTLARALSSKDPPTKPLAAVTIDDRWFVQSAKNFPLAPEDRAWEWNAAKQNAILDAGGWTMYANAHLVVDLSLKEEGQKWPEVKKAYKLPVAELIDGELHYVWNAAKSANGALHGSRTPMKVPNEVKVSASKTAAAIYRKFDKDDSNVVLTEMFLESFDDIRRRVEAAISRLYSYKDEDDISHYVWLVDIGPEAAVFELDAFLWAVPYSIQEDGTVLLGEPVAAERAWKERESDKVIQLTLYAFPVRGALATEASEDVVGDDGGLVWKEICKVSQWFKLDSGRRIEITKQFLLDLISAFTAKVVPYVTVPADDHHYESGGVVPAEDNTGFVEKLKLVGQSLWAGFRFTDDETREKIEEGTVKDVSIYAAPDVHDPRTGEKWPWVLMHVLLTNYPQVQGLAPFGNEEPVAADAFTGAKIIHLEEVNDMGNDGNNAVTLTAEEAQQLQAFRALNLSPDQINEWQAMGLSFERIKTLVAEEEKTRSKARDLEVQAILLALQGQGEHPGVVQVKDARHWPVVCTAVEKVLKERVKSMALSVNDDGTTGLDEVVLSIVNAIPAEGRMSLTAQPTGDREPPAEDGEATEEQIDDLDKRLR